MKYLKTFENITENVVGGGGYDFAVETLEIIKIFKKLSDDDYEKLIDYFGQDWDRDDMIEDLNLEMLKNTSKELQNKINIKYK